MRARALILASFALASACSGVESPSGLQEPLRVRGGVFKSGELPGFDAADAGDDTEGPSVTSVESPNILVAPGQLKDVKGYATDDAYSVALRFADEGTGYWVLPLGAPDPAYPGQLSFRTQVDLSPELSPGEHVLQAVAIDGEGDAGARYEFRFCATRPYDDSLNACDATVRPPAAVISLHWNVDADLDLVVKTPSGKIVDARHPTTADASGDDAIDVDAPGVGVLRPDSNADCHLDSQRRETLTWNTSPEPGTYLVYVNVFEACGKTTVHFDVDAYARTRGEVTGSFDLVEIQEPLRGVLLGASANGGASRGLYVGKVEFP